MKTYSANYANTANYVCSYKILQQLFNDLIGLHKKFKTFGNIKRQTLALKNSVIFILLATQLNIYYNKLWMSKVQLLS